MVAPRMGNPGRLHWASPGDRRSIISDECQPALVSEGDWRGLRPWRSGDSPRQIHWPSSLRQPPTGNRQSWVVRDQDPDDPMCGDCFLVFHSWGNPGGLIRLDRFERAVSLMSGLMRNLRRRGARCSWTSDFTGWDCHATESQSDWRDTLSLLTRARRSSETAWERVLQAICKVPGNQTVLVVSDEPLDHWIGRLPKRPDLHGLSPSGKSETTRLLHPR